MDGEPATDEPVTDVPVSDVTATNDPVTDQEAPDEPVTDVTAPAEPAPDQPALSKRVTASTSRVLTLTVIDQGASSLSNFALAGIVAHFSGAHELGVYAIVLSTYIIGQGLVRSCTSDCMLTRHETDDELMAPYEQGGYLSALIAACFVSLLIAGSCVFLGHDFIAPLLIFAACFPLMALQDFSRYIGISRHDPAYAIRLDTAWLVLFIVAFVIEKKTGHVSLPWLIGAWTGTGALVGLWTIPKHLTLKGARGLLRFWVKSEVSIGWKFAGQFLLTSSWAYVIFYLLALVLTVGALGVFKLSQLAMGPLSVASVGLQSAMISMAAKKFHTDPRRTLRFIFLVATGTAFVTAGWMVLVYFAPIHIVKNVLGPTWPQARAIFIYVGFGFIVTSWSGAAAAGLRALRAAKENLWLAVVLIPFLIVPAIVGAKINGLRGAAIGSLISNCIITLFTVIVLKWVANRRHGLKDGDDAGDADGTGDTDTEADTDVGLPGLTDAAGETAARDPILDTFLTT
jgi:O-antigen/teichoic acid export membrane protein